MEQRAQANGVRVDGELHTNYDDNKYQTAYKQEQKNILAGSENNSLHLADRSHSNKEYFSFVNQ